jgi:hypothetical protein
MFHLFGLGFLVCAALYFLPTIIGLHKRNAGAIFGLNLLLGWTLVGWVVALVWALTTDPAVSYGPTVHAAPSWDCICGAHLNRGQRFCSACGARIGWPGTAT